MRDTLYIEEVIGSSGKNYREIKDDVAAFSEKILTVISAGIATGSPLHEDEMTGPLISSLFFRKLAKKETHIYKVADKFGGHLDKVNLKLSSSVIPFQDNKFYCIEFPKSFYSEHTDEYHRTALVWMGRDIQYDCLGKTINVEIKDSDRSIVFVWPDYDKNGKLTHSQSFCRMDIDAADTLEEIVLSQTQGEGGLTLDYIAKLAAFTMKCLIYIESGDPDLVPEPHVVPLTKKPKKLRKFYEEHYPVDIMRVGYGFHRRHYSVDSSEVSGHFRWQPYGPGREKVKLIWIEEHTRRYSKDP